MGLHYVFIRLKPKGYEWTRCPSLRGQDAASHRVVEQFKRVFPHGGRAVAGVLITGESGLGKSELGLELISRSHGLVADDAVE